MLKSIKTLVVASAAAIAAMGGVGSANAAVIVSATQSNIGVTFDSVGAINLNGLKPLGSVTAASSFVNAGFAQIVPQATGSYFTGIIGPSSFGSGSSTAATSMSGSFFLLAGSNGSIGLPSGYTSGSPINSSLSFAGSTFASLGITPGTYLYTFGSGTNADSITVQIGNAVASAVPEPATWGMMIFGMGAIGFAMRRKKASTTVKFA